MFSKALIFLLIVIICCSRQLRTPITKEGKKIKIQLIADKNLREGLSEDHIEQRAIMTNFIARDLQKRFEHAGYVIGLQAKRDDIKLAEGFDHILLVTLKGYHFKSKSARAWVGVAAGPAILHLDYAFYDPNLEPILSDSLSIGSAISEERCARALDLKIFNAVDAKMEEMYGRAPRQN